MFLVCTWITNKGYPSWSYSIYVSSKSFTCLQYIWWYVGAAAASAAVDYITLSVLWPQNNFLRPSRTHKQRCSPMGLHWSRRYAAQHATRMLCIPRTHRILNRLAEPCLHKLKKVQWVHAIFYIILCVSKGCIFGYEAWRASRYYLATIGST